MYFLTLVQLGAYIGFIGESLRMLGQLLGF